MLRLRHPSNGYVLTLRLCWLWALLFGAFYFAKHRAWSQAFLSIVAALVTLGLSWVFVYPFLARRIVRTSYLMRGWIEETSPTAVTA